MVYHKLREDRISDGSSRAAAMENRLESDVTYTVPRRFGTRTVLAAMTVFGLLLMAARLTELPTVFIVFYAVFLALICVIQMVLVRAPRFGSIAVGSIYMPLAAYIADWLPIGSDGLLDQVLPRMDTSHARLWLFAIGGFLGYLTGAILASIFMFTENLRLPHRRRPQAVGNVSPLESSPSPQDTSLVRRESRSQ